MLVAFSGFKGSGKDTAAKVLIEEYGFTRIFFAEPILQALKVLNPIVWPDPDKFGSVVRFKDVLDQFGWDKAKQYTEVRRLGQVFGTEVGREFFSEDCWLQIMDKDYPDLSWENTRYVITDCRFENECQFVRDKGGSITWIYRSGTGSDGHASESDVPFNYASTVLRNDTTIEDLHDSVRLLMKMRGIDSASNRN